MMSLLAWIVPVALADIPAGDPIEEAISVQVSAAGLDAIADLLPVLVPADPMIIDDTSDAAGAICLEYAYELSNMWVNLRVTDASITPANGMLTLDADVWIQINDGADPFTLIIEAICLIDEDCSGWIDPFLVTAHMDLALDVVGPPGSKAIEATVHNVQIDDHLQNEDLQIDCLLSDIEDVLGWFGLSVFDLLIGTLADTMAGEIETLLNDALVAASFSDQLDLEGALVDIALEPAAVHVKPVGLEILLAARLDGQPDTCVSAWDPGSSVSSGGARPDPTYAPPGTHAAAHVSADMINQALYAFWRGGLLCQELGGANSAIDLGGFAIDTALLGLLGGDPYRELFPDPAPMVLALSPRQAPVAVTDGAQDVVLAVDALELILFGELEGRMARAFSVDLAADFGANLDFDGTTGELGVELVIDDGALDATLSGDVMVPGHEDEVVATFEAAVGGLLGTILDGLLGDALAFVLPTVEGIGLTSASVEASGPEADWLALYAQVGEAEYADPDAAGCGGCGGTTTPTGGDCGGCSDCGGTGTTGTCSVAGRLGPAWLFATLLVVLRRRRR